MIRLPIGTGIFMNWITELATNILYGALSANRSTHVTIAGKEYLYFGGSNYLGLAHRAELLEEAVKAFETYGLSSGASRLTSGENELLLNLEKELSAWSGSESSLVFPAGFMSNEAVLEGVDDRVDVWVVQKNAHASIQHAVKLTRHPVIVDPGIDSDLPLPARWNLNPSKRIGVILEEVDPLTGQLLNTDNIMSKLREQDLLILDEAHSFGVIGENGKGVFEHYALEHSQNMIRTGTFSKALGTYGGFALASREITDQVKEKSLCFKGSTSLPPMVCAASIASLKLIQDRGLDLLGQLRRNIDHLYSSLIAAGFQPLNSQNMPIFYLNAGELNEKCTELLGEESISVPQMGAYFSGSGPIGMRWTIQAGHSTAELDKLLALLARCKM